MPSALYLHGWTYFLKISLYHLSSDISTSIQIENTSASSPRTAATISPHTASVGDTMKSMKPEWQLLFISVAIVILTKTKKALWILVMFSSNLILISLSVTYLWLRHHSVVAIAQWREVKALLLLLVALLEELLHAPGDGDGDAPGHHFLANIHKQTNFPPCCPLAVKLPPLCRVGDVAGVKKHRENPLLVHAEH